MYGGSLIELWEAYVDQANYKNCTSVATNKNMDWNSNQSYVPMVSLLTTLDL